MVKFHFLASILTRVFSMTPRDFSCTYFVQYLSPGLDKFSPRSIKCVFVGYSKTQKRYWCYNPSIRKYCVCIYTFFKSVSYFFSQNHVTISETILPPLSVSLLSPASADFSFMSMEDTSEPLASKPSRF